MVCDGLGMGGLMDRRWFQVIFLGNWMTGNGIHSHKITRRSEVWGWEYNEFWTQGKPSLYQPWLEPKRGTSKPSIPSLDQKSRVLDEVYNHRDPRLPDAFLKIFLSSPLVLKTEHGWKWPLDGVLWAKTRTHMNSFPTFLCFMMLSCNLFKKSI